HRRQLRQRILRNGPLGLESGLGAHAPAKVEGLLHIHAEIDDVLQHLNLTDGLVKALHDAEAEQRLPVPGGEAWNDRVERALSRRDLIEMAVSESEVSAPVLEQHARARTGDERAKRASDRVDEGAEVAFAVGGGEIDGV